MCTTITLSTTLSKFNVWPLTTVGNRGNTLVQKYYEHLFYNVLSPAMYKGYTLKKVKEFVYYE
jgi:hypothetical protein